jgi:hypothetical protein
LRCGRHPIVSNEPPLHRILLDNVRRQSSYGSSGESWCAEVESLRFLKRMAARFTNQAAQPYRAPLWPLFLVSCYFLGRSDPGHKPPLGIGAISRESKNQTFRIIKPSQDAKRHPGTPQVGHQEPIPSLNGALACFSFEVQWR